MDYSSYKENYEFSFSQRDANNHVLPSAILESFQDIGSTHAKLLGVGYEDLLAQNYIWVVTKIRFQIKKDIPFNKLSLKTWPLKKGLLDFNREFKLTDENDEVYLVGTSKWCVVDINTRKLVRARNIDYKNIEAFKEETSFEESYELLKEFEHNESNFKKRFDINYSLLDHNFHLNNTKYASFILDSIDDIEKKEIVDLQINFLKECLYKDYIKTYCIRKNDNELLFEGIRNDSEVSFLALVKLKDI